MKLLPTSCVPKQIFACLLHIVVCCSVVSVLFASNLCAQTTIQFEHLSLEQGLPQSSINCALQDRKGFLWFGTQDGFCRYDGYSFLVHRHNPKDSSTISSNDITAMCEDKQGYIWIGTRDGGLNRYNPKTGAFTCFRHDALNPRSLPSNYISTVYEDGQGTLWVGTQVAGLGVLDRTTGAVTTFHHQPGNSSSLSNDSVRCVLEDSNGTLWVGTRNGLNTFDRSRSVFTAIFNQPGNPQSLSYNNVGCLYEDRQGTLWVGTVKGLNALERHNRQNRAFTVYLPNPTNPQALPANNGIWTVMEDRHGIVWIGTDGGGVCSFDRIRGTFVSFRAEQGNQTALTNNSVLTVLEDRQGILWVGTDGGGVCKYDPRRSLFTIHSAAMTSSKPRSEALIDNIINSLYEDRQGILWIGTDAGLHYLNRPDGKFVVFQHDAKNPQSLPHDYVVALHEDRTGLLWVGTRGGGLSLFDRVRKTFRTFKNDPTTSRSISDNQINTIYEDHQGMLWIGTNKGLNRFERTTETFTTFHNDPHNPQTLSNDAVLALYEDRWGILWVGTGGGGLNKFDRTSETFRSFRNNSNNPKSLSSDFVYSLCEDTGGNLWAGTNTGLNKFDRSTGTFTVLYEANGLPNDLIYGILPDKRGNFWISTNKGICKMNPRQMTFHSYDVRDGLQSNEFNQYAYHQGRSGRMYFGGVNGFNEFFPDSIRDNPYTPPVVITSFKKFNKAVALDTVLSEMHSITMDYTDNFFSFEFAALNYSISEKNRYMYMMEGFDKDWIDAETKREATYTNLDGKTYTFRVKASNNDGVWNEVGTAITVVIRPPWWKTWWFRLVAIVTGVTGGLAWYRLRVYQIQVRNQVLAHQVEQRTAELKESNEEIQRQNRQLLDLNKEKNEIMGIVAHDLKNPLSNIRMLAKLLNQESKVLPPAEISEFSSDIQNIAERMFDLITNLLNVNAIEQGGVKLHPSTFDIQALVQSIVHDYKTSADEKNIRLGLDNILNANGEGIPVYADRSATVQVIDNIISNAVKYSPLDKEIFVRIMPNKTTKHIRVEIQDQGPGLSEDDKKLLFGKFARLSAQPTGGEDSTGLGLSIVKKLVEAMHGQVWCESELGDGATFIVELPVQKPM